MARRPYAFGDLLKLLFIGPQAGITGAREVV
jgi:hypothetical protein